MRSLPIAAVLLVLAVLPPALRGQSVDPLVLPEAAPAKEAGPPLWLAEDRSVPPLAALGVAPDRALQTIYEWNATGGTPAYNGFARHLPEPVRIELQRSPEKGTAAVRRDGALVWGGEIRVEGAWRLRLHLADVRLPPDARLWVYGEDGQVAPSFGTGLSGPDGGIWTPSVGGEAVRLEVELPGPVPVEGAGFVVDRVLELVPATPDRGKDWNKALPCRVDGSCIETSEFGFITQFRRAVAMAQFVIDNFSAYCSSSLLNDSDPRTTIPYLLTAHHCVQTPEQAASVEAIFDYRTADCDGAAPDVGSLPRAVGATLVATTEESDATLLRLSTLPPGRVLLGWTAVPPAPESVLYRLSHPFDGGPLPQVYSTTRVDPALPNCLSLPRPIFIHSSTVKGGATNGSSGSPAILANGQVVGQLNSGCGADNSCEPGVRTLDGAFAYTYPVVRPFLDPVRPCVPGAETLCLAGNRFEVKVTWQNQFNGQSGTGKAVRRSDTTGFFYFSSPSNTELIVKILDFGDVVKVFYGQLTDLRFTLTVTDSRTGASRVYGNGPQECGAIDQEAFRNSAALTTPKAQRNGCAPGANALCLLSRRFKVEVAWRNPGNGTSGRGVAAALSDQSGLFSFGDRANVELVVKALPFQSHVAVFYGALSDLEYTLTVTDTRTGAVKTYINPAGRFCGGIDNQAF